MTSPLVVVDISWSISFEICDRGWFEDSWEDKCQWKDSSCNFVDKHHICRKAFEESFGVVNGSLVRLYRKTILWYGLFKKLEEVVNMLIVRAGYANGLLLRHMMYYFKKKFVNRIFVDNNFLIKVIWIICYSLRALHIINIRQKLKLN